jgi:hypothetical protein
VGGARLCFTHRKTLPKAALPSVAKSKSIMNRELKNKGGRPKVNPADKKSIAITIRLTPVEYARIRARVNAANFSSVTEFITYSALNNLIVQHFLRSDVEFVKDIAKMGNNLNQLARLANTSGFPIVADAATVLIAQIKDVVQAIGRRL